MASKLERALTNQIARLKKKYPDGSPSLDHLEKRLEKLQVEQAGSARRKKIDDLRRDTLNALVEPALVQLIARRKKEYPEGHPSIEEIEERIRVLKAARAKSKKEIVTDWLQVSRPWIIGIIMFLGLLFFSVMGEQWVQKFGELGARILFWSVVLTPVTVVWLNGLYRSGHHIKADAGWWFMVGTLTILVSWLMHLDQGLFLPTPCLWIFLGTGLLLLTVGGITLLPRKNPHLK